MKKCLSIILIFSFILQNAIFALAEDESTAEFGTGLAYMSDEMWNEFNATLPLIVDVKPNEIALSRFENTEVRAFSAAVKEIAVEEIGNEVTYVYPGEAGAGSVAPSTFPLTSAVDVSKALTFPPIGNQGNIPSCTAWALGYYQLTNNNCVARGTAAKTVSGSAVNENIMSPRFIYQLINGGLSKAAFYSEACAALMSYGCPNVKSYSADINIKNLEEWCTDTDIWNSAMYNKPQKIAHGDNNSTEPVTANTPFVIDIKRLLSNGYVVTVPTYVNSFNYTTKTTTGAYGCRYMSDTRLGSHAMTIVGYDDNFWVDVNNNSRKDDGENGAFKVANSWGEHAPCYTEGYVWMPYDAIGDVSSVQNTPLSREGAFKDYYFIEPEKDYTPLLIANVQMTTTNRNQVAVKLGISDTDTFTPTELVSVAGEDHIAFNNPSKGKMAENNNILDRNFAGSYTKQTITIPFDLTPVIKQVYGRNGFTEKTQKRFYVEVTDADDNGSNIVLGNVSVVEPITRKGAFTPEASGAIASNNSVMKNVDWQITPFVGFNNRQDITLVFSSNVRAESVANNIYLSKDGRNIYPQCDVIDNKVIVGYPENGYVPDTEYELHIGTDVKSNGGNSMQNEKVILLYMLGEYYVWN